MAEKKEGLFKRLFRFGRKKEATPVAPPELEVRDDDVTENTALAEPGAPDPSVHMEAAANPIADAEAGAAASDEAPGILPLDDVPAPPPAEEIDHDAIAE